MLKFAANVTCQGTILGPSGQARSVIEALFLGSAVIIHDGLSEVIAVGERFADDLGGPGVSRLHLQRSILAAIEQDNFPAEFFLQGRVKRRGFAGLDFVICDAIRSFFDLTRTFHARPGTHIGEPAVNVSERSQAIHRWVNPAIQRYVRRPHIPRFTACVRVTLTERAPSGDFRIAVLRVGAKDLSTEIPPQGAAQNDVRSKVLMSHNPRSVDPARQSVD